MSNFKNLSKNFDANDLLMQQMEFSGIYKEILTTNKEGLA